jgi:hypothetical protein
MHHVAATDAEVALTPFLSPVLVRVEYSVGLSASEARRIKRMIEQNRQALLEQWNGYFSQ